MSSTPLVSFVIPCFNYGRFLVDCLNGVFAQSVYTENFEIIAIDDCSSDDTWEILQSWNDPRLKLIKHNENRGHVFTVNEGLSLAKGKFVARIDPDDRYRSNFLSTLLPCFESDCVGMVYGDASVIDADGNITVERCPQPHGGKAFVGWALIDILHKNYICAPTAIARREAWQKHLPIWEGLSFNDIYFNMMIARDWHFAYVPEIVADYRVHGSNHHTSITVNKSEEPSLFRVLDWVYSHAETREEYERAKIRAKRSVFGTHYKDLGDKYFGAGHSHDAQRCYRIALINKPSYLGDASVLRRLFATLIGLGNYNALKNCFQRRDRKMML